MRKLSIQTMGVIIHIIVIVQIVIMTDVGLVVILTRVTMSKNYKKMMVKIIKKLLYLGILI